MDLETGNYVSQFLMLMINACAYNLTTTVNTESLTNVSQKSFCCTLVHNLTAC